MVELDRTEVVRSLDAAYGAVTELAADLALDDFTRPTRCEGFAVGPLLVHLLLDVQRALMTFATPAAPPPTGTSSRTGGTSRPTRAGREAPIPTLMSGSWHS